MFHCSDRWLGFEAGKTYQDTLDTTFVLDARSGMLSGQQVTEVVNSYSIE